jgi:hypothetical protein
MPIFKKNATPGKLSLIFIGSILLFIVLLGLDAPKTEQPTTTSIPEPKTTTQVNTPTPSYSFDIPSLIGKNIDEIRQIFGSPVDTLTEPSAEQLKLGTDQWDNTFKKDDKELLVTFNPVTRTIVDFFISGDNKDKLILVGNLKNSDTKYVIEPVKMLKDPSQITGIKITPNP